MHAIIRNLTSTAIALLLLSLPLAASAQSSSPNFALTEFQTPPNGLSNGAALPVQIAFPASFETGSTTCTAAYLVSWGDGSAVDSNSGSGHAQSCANVYVSDTHSYANPGTYTISVTDPFTGVSQAVVVNVTASGAQNMLEPAIVPGTNSYLFLYSTSSATFQNGEYIDFGDGNASPIPSGSCPSSGMLGSSRCIAPVMNSDSNGYELRYLYLPGTYTPELYDSSGNVLNSATISVASASGTSTTNSATTTVSTDQSALIAQLEQEIAALTLQVQALIAMHGHHAPSSTASSTAVFFASPSSGAVPLTVAFSGRTPPSGYTIDFGDNSGTQTFQGTSVCPTSLSPCNMIASTSAAITTHTYQSAGTYTATLKDPFGALIGQAVVTPGSTNTSASLSAAPSSGSAPLSVTFTGQAPLNGYILNFGDGSTPLSQISTSCQGSSWYCNSLSTSSMSLTTHTYQSAGNFTATLTNASGNPIATTSVSVTSATSSIATAATATCSGTVAIYNWTPVGGATYYKIWQQDTQTQFIWNNLIAYSSTYAVSGLYGSSYNWSVSACNAYGCAPPVQGNNFACTSSTGMTYPSSPTAMCSSNTASFAWTPMSGATSYSLWIRDNATLFERNNMIAYSPVYRINGLVGNSYDWSVAGCTSAGCSAPVAGNNFSCAGSNLSCPTGMSGTYPNCYVGCRANELDIYGQCVPLQ